MKTKIASPLLTALLLSLASLATVGFVLIEKPTIEKRPGFQIYRLPLIGSGDYHTCALLSDGIVRCWGNNAHGQLGDGGPISFHNTSSTPVPVPGLDRVKGLAGGADHTCAAIADGTVECWGSNDLGQLGLGNDDGQFSSPAAVPGLSGVLTLAAGYRTSCVVRSGGGAQCWGHNDRAVLQDVQNQYHYSPTSVPGVGNVKGIDSGGGHTCVLKTNGKVMCWGYDGSGQVGDGGGIDTQDIQEVPTEVDGLTDVKSISLGTGHTCAVLEDGTVKCWGDSEYAQLGESPSTDRSTPITVPYLSDVVQIAAGRHHSCALLENGNVKCWGSNQFGQLGIGNNPPVGSSQATKVHGLSGVIAIAGGSDHTCALLANDQVKCWGQNGYGQLGDGTKENRFTPVSVEW